MRAWSAVVAGMLDATPVQPPARRADRQERGRRAGWRLLSARRPGVTSFAFRAAAARRRSADVRIAKTLHEIVRRLDPAELAVDERAGVGRESFLVAGLAVLGQGEVLAVGKGKILENGEVRPLDLKKGDKVIFGKYTGTEVKVDGEDLLVMREDDVMAVIEK